MKKNSSVALKLIKIWYFKYEYKIIIYLISCKSGFFLCNLKRVESYSFFQSVPIFVLYKMKKIELTNCIKSQVIIFLI